MVFNRTELDRLKMSAPFKADKQKLYAILEVTKEADATEIKKAYRKLAMVRILHTSKWAYRDVHATLV